MKKHLIGALVLACSMTVLAQTKVMNTTVQNPVAADCAPNCNGRLPDVANSRVRVENFYPDPSQMRLSQCPEGQNWIHIEGSPYVQCGDPDDKRQVREKRENAETPAAR